MSLNTPRERAVASDDGTGPGPTAEARHGLVVVDDFSITPVCMYPDLAAFLDTFAAEDLNIPAATLSDALRVFGRATLTTHDQGNTFTLLRPSVLADLVRLHLDGPPGETVPGFVTKPKR